MNRLTDRADLLSWEAVGRLDTAGIGTCSGVLIAPKLVLTAAHCVVERTSEQAISPNKAYFRAGLRDGVSVAERAGARIAVHPRYVATRNDGGEGARYDVAIVELFEAIPSALADPFVVATPSLGLKDVSVVSYAHDRNEALSRQRKCGVIGLEKGLIAFDCDVHFGSSGAPVFEKSTYRARIVSLVSRGTRDEDAVIAVGMELPTVVSELKAVLRSGRGVVALEQSVPRAPKIGRGTARSGAKFVRVD